MTHIRGMGSIHPYGRKRGGHRRGINWWKWLFLAERLYRMYKRAQPKRPKVNVNVVPSVKAQQAYVKQWVASQCDDDELMIACSSQGMRVAHPRMRAEITELIAFAYGFVIANGYIQGHEMTVINVLAEIPGVSSVRKVFHL